MSSTDAVKTGLLMLCATFRAEVDAWQARAYTRALKDVPEAFVMAGADRLVAEAAAGRQFYPMPTAPQWKQACAAEIAQARQKASAVLLGQCSHAGHWESVRLADGTEAVRRCGCYRRALAEMDAVAAPLPMIAAASVLPAQEASGEP